jgi:hypothetical protein
MDLSLAKWLAIVGLILVGGAAFVVWAVLRDNEIAAEVEAYCRSRGMVSAAHSEQLGKTRTTARFCVDGRGQVFVPLPVQH